MRAHSGWWWLLAPGLVVLLSSWCQLHGSALGTESPGLDVSVPWALRSAVGWVLAGGLLAHFGARILDSAFAERNPWLVRGVLALAIPALTLSSEVILLSGDTPAALWLYNRLPLHLPFGVLLLGGYLLIRARNPRVATTSVREISAHTVEVMTGTGHTQVSLDDVECLEADRNYINVHTPQRSYLLRQTLTSLEKSLRADTFLRVHRSIIVNRAKIRERRRGGVLVLASGRQVRVSRGFADRVQ